MRILMIGTIVPSNHIARYSAVSVAGNTMQWQYLMALHDAGYEVDVITHTPRRLRPFFKTSKFIFAKNYVERGVRFFSVGFLNIPGLKNISLVVSTLKVAKRQLKKNSYDMILTYNTATPHAYPALVLRKSNLFKVAIIADLPRPVAKFQWFRRWESKQQLTRIAKFNALIPIADAIALDYAPKVPFLRIEGGVEPFKVQLIEPPKQPVFVYAGALDELSGLEQIISHFKLFKFPCELHIYGQGPLETHLKKVSGPDDRIKFQGFIEPERLNERLSSATALLLPRSPEDNITHYTFPSKLLTYMITGVPVIMHDLKGVPYDFHPFIHRISPTQDAWLEVFRDITHHPQTYFERAYQGQVFLNEHKTWNKHSKAIRIFFEALTKERDSYV